MKNELKAALQKAVLEAENWSEFAKNLADLVPRNAQTLFVSEFIKANRLRLTRIRARQVKDIVSEIAAEELFHFRTAGRSLRPDRDLAAEINRYFSLDEVTSGITEIAFGKEESSTVNASGPVGGYSTEQEDAPE